MTATQLQQLLNGKTLEVVNGDQDTAHGLRLLVMDPTTNEVGLLAIEPCTLILPDEIVLDYSYQVIQSPFGPAPEECLISDLQTRVGPDYDGRNVPFLKGEQSGLF